MRIVMLSTGHPVYDSYPNGGGIQHQVLGLATQMAERGHEMHVICRAVQNSERIDGAVTFHQVPVRLRDQVASVLMFSKEAARLIDALEPDVVSAYERFSAYFPSRQTYPMTFTTENYDAFRYYRAFAVSYNPINILVHPWKCRLEESVMRRSRLVVALTRSICDYLRSIGISHVQVIPNGVFSNDYTNRGDRKFILYAGRLDAPKRVDLLIKAYAKLKDFHNEYSLLIVGMGPLRNTLMTLVHDFGLSSRVMFRDWISRSELRVLLGKCTVFVLPSQYEALPVVLLEAMASSKPVIASNIEGPKDIIDHLSNGMLFEPGNAEDLAGMLSMCLRDASLRVSLAIRARRAVEETYDFRSVSTRLLESYANLPEPNPRAS